jgi:prepilin-type processing-associated H-X9-DG protein/prepilin-type N-terminal cleavage/methylation domain-containing protein
MKHLQRAFSLVELLVVIAIIAVLIALLLPTISAAQEQSKSIKCLSNLQQLALAALQYSGSYGGSYPIAYYGDYRPPLSIQWNWDFATVTNVSTGQITSQPGLLWLGMSSAPVQQCPSYDGSSNTAADPYTGYNYNSSFIGGGAFGPAVFAPIKAVQVRHPSHCVLFGDGQYYGGADKYMRSPFPGPADIYFDFLSPASGTQGFRHRGKTNVAFCDGHAETLGVRYTIQSQQATQQPGAGTGYLSADNSVYDPAQ